MACTRCELSFTPTDEALEDFAREERVHREAARDEHTGREDGECSLTNNWWIAFLSYLLVDRVGLVTVQ